jgi:hypothetical protein
VDFARALAAFPPFPLVEFDASACTSLSAEQWIVLLALPTVQSLRILRTGAAQRQMEPSAIRSIAALPRLHTLAIVPQDANPSRWSLLADAAALTSLDVTDSVDELDSSALPAVAQACSRLTHLTMRDPALHGAAFLELFSLPNMQRLQSLCIEGLYAAGGIPHFMLSFDPVPPEDYSASFRLLPRLHTLHLVVVNDIDVLLPHLVHLSSLHHLTIEFNPNVQLRQTMTQVPAVDVLARMLERQPLLTCTLQLRGWKTDSGSVQQQQQQQQQQPDLVNCQAAFTDAQQLQSFRHRFTVLR